MGYFRDFIFCEDLVAIPFSNIWKVTMLLGNSNSRKNFVVLTASDFFSARENIFISGSPSRK